MPVSSLADDTAASKCIECGAAISSKAKFCLKCGVSQTKVTPASVKCVSCDAEIAEFSKFCEECGALQTASPTGRIDKRTPTQKMLLKFTPFGILGMAIVLACIVWLNSHPISPKAQFELGEKYHFGRGVQKSDAQAVSWYRKAADQGDEQAQYMLGSMYKSGTGGLAQDYAQAVYWYQKAADQGDISAKIAIAFVDVDVEQQREQKAQSSTDSQSTSLSSSPAPQGSSR